MKAEQCYFSNYRYFLEHVCKGGATPSLFLGHHKLAGIKGRLSQTKRRILHVVGTRHEQPAQEVETAAGAGGRDSGYQNAKIAAVISCLKRACLSQTLLGRSS